MRRFFIVLSLLLLCLPSLAQRRKQVDPRDTLQYYCDYTQAGKKFLLGLNFSGEEARVYTYRVLRRSCAPVGEPFKVEALRDSVSFVNVAGTDYILFSYLSDGEDPGTLDWTLKAVSFSGDRFEHVNFVGKPLPPEGERFRIEGFSGSAMRANTDELTDYLDSLLLADKRLVVLPESVYKTDKVVEWWLQNNPSALSSAKKVLFASLPADCSAVVAFEGSAGGAGGASGAGAVGGAAGAAGGSAGVAAGGADAVGGAGAAVGAGSAGSAGAAVVGGDRAAVAGAGAGAGAGVGAVAKNKVKSKSGRYQLASVDLRGYTLVIVKNLKQNSYTLVWAEPTGVKKSDRRLMNLYFADDNTIAMVFYHGNSMLKYRIALGSGQLWRS